MTTPQNLAHKPITSIDDYAKHDCLKKTDVQSLSIGIAQYDSSEISAKVFRYSGTKWSRQSEELPLRRVIDLSSTILKSILKSSGNPQPDTILQLSVINEAKLHRIANYYKENRKDLLPKLQELQIILNYFLQEEPKLF